MTKKDYNQAYYAANKKRLQADMRRYRAENKEVINVKDRARYLIRREKVLQQKHAQVPIKREARKIYNHNRWMANKENLKEGRKEWYEKNKQSIMQRNYAYVKANRDKANKWRKNWQAKNPGKVTAYDAERRALELNAKTDKVAVDKFYVWVRAQEFIPCTYCGAHLTGKQIEVDHVVPLSRGGDHLPSNFCIACRSCNASKKDKLLSEWTNRPQLN